MVDYNSCLRRPANYTSVSRFVIFPNKSVDVESKELQSELMTIKII